MPQTDMKIVTEVKRKVHDAEGAVNQIDVPMTRRLGLAEFAKQTFKQIGNDHVGAFAGNLAYQALFAMFPFFLFLISLLGLFHATSLVDSLINRAGAAMPADAVRLLRSSSHSITQSHATGAFGISAMVSILVALWGASGGFRAVMEAMNVMYNVEESRPFWKKYGISIVLALAATVLIVGSMVLVIAGPQIGGAVADRLGLGATFQWIWTIVQWPVLLAAVLLAFALIYYLAPDVEQRFRFVSPGALVAVGIWLLFSILFSLYVNTLGSYSKTYGALAGIAIFLLYMYYSAFIMLVGAEINQVIEEHAPGGKREGQKSSSGQHAGSDRENRTLEVLHANRPR